jgi:tetratricopeptide (TPR) repeat protein
MTFGFVALMVGWFGVFSQPLWAQNATNVTQLIRDSQSALAAEKLGEAERLARSAVDLDPAHPPAWRQYGITLLRGSKPKEAATALQRAVSMDEKDATSWRGLAQAYWQSQQQNEAVRALSSYLRLKPEDAGVWRDLAAWLTRLERGDEAIAALERVVELKPEEASAWRELGSWLTRQQRSEQAVAALEHVVKLKPDDASAWREMAIGLTRLNRHEQAVAALDQVVKLKPDDASAWREMAAGLAKLERHEQAIAALEKVVKLTPDNAAAWRELATELTRLERHEPAVAALERVTKLTPENAAAWHEMASGLTKLERYEKAVAALEQVIKLTPKDASAWRALALLHQQGGRTEEAAKAFEQALAIRPDDPATKRDLGWILWTQGRRDEALARLTEAVETGVEPRDRVIYQVVARLSEEGASDKALAFLRRVNPKDSPSILGLALARAGRFRAAEPLLMNAWQNGEQTPDVGLYLAYSRAVNSQFADIAKYLEPVLSSTARLSAERAELALESLRLGNTRPETPALVSRLESVLDKAGNYTGRVTDILETGAEACRVRGDPAQALHLYRRVLERDPDRASWIWAVLLAEKVEGKTPFAWLDSYEKRISKPARLAGVKGLRADRLGHAEEAVPALRESLALEPKQPPLRQILFQSLLGQGRVAEARVEAEWFAKQVEAGEAVLRSYLAEMLTRLGDTREALAQWEMLHQANPEVTYYGIEAASALYRLYRPDEAMEILKAMAGTSADSRIYELMAEIASARARTAEAVDWSARGLAAAPSQALLRYYAEGLEKLGTNAPAALASAQTYLKQDPGSVPMTLLAGRMLEIVGATNEVRQFHLKQLDRNPVFVPSLTALRDRATRDGQIDEATGYARVRAEFQPDSAEALRAYANSLAQQDHFRKSLNILRPLARTPLEKAVPLLVYQSISRHPYAGRNSVEQISRHVKRLSEDGVVFINAFSQIAEKPDARHVMIVLIDPEAEVIEALDPVLKQHNARVVYAGNAALPTLTLSGQPIPERLATVLASGRWQLASGGPAELGRKPVNEAKVLGNPLTHPLVSEEACETRSAFSERIDQALAGSSRTLTQADERILVYPSGDFGHRSLDTDTNNVALLRNAVAHTFTHAVYFDDSGFYRIDPTSDPLRIPARVVPPEWDEKSLSTYLTTGNPLARARLELARVLYWNGQHEDAHAAFASATEAGADSRETIFNWGMNSDRQGDLPTAREKLLAAQAQDPESERIIRALERLEERRRPQATAYLYGWKDNEDRDHYRYGAFGDAYVSELLRLGVLADRDRWSTTDVGTEYGTRVGLRGLAYLAPQVWLAGSLWQLDMDSLDSHWGGEAMLRVPNPLLSGYLMLAASREEIETVEALRANIDANTYALRTYTRLSDLFDLFADVSEIERSDGNNTEMLDGRLLYRLQEWPYVGVGWRFRFADSDRDPPEYWAPEQLQQHQAHISVRGSWGRLSGSMSAEAGYAEEKDTSWQFVWGARGGLDYALTPRISLSGELGYFESTDYERMHGRIGVTGRF